MSGITIKEIAKLCGVGVATVSRAINDHPDINEETKTRIRAVIEEYGYVPNNSARNLKRSDARTIAVLVKGITNPFFSRMIRIFENECYKRGYSLVLQHVEEHQNEVDVAALLEKEKRLNGMIFLGGNFSHSREKLDRISVPFVLNTVAVRDSADYAAYAYVAVDDVRESKRMTEYLLARGKKRIAIICAEEADESIGTLRLRGYLEALKAHGIAADERLIVRVGGEDVYTCENGYRAVKQLCETKVAFDAVYAISDTLAFGALRALHDAGLRVPADVALAGFDGLETGKYLVPSLTTLQQPDEGMAHTAIELLFEQLAGKTEGKRHCIYEGALWIGESV